MLFSLCGGVNDYEQIPVISASPCKAAPCIHDTVYTLLSPQTSNLLPISQSFKAKGKRRGRVNFKIDSNCVNNAFKILGHSN